ncbi:GMP-PDE, delta subunit family protein [Trypanosoma rangeli]|uniref:GMP-PDE, delta subunit family protein n=1 Tax=Trypanosoma rangeli TaxID=5698 RepID=A0A3R7R7R0_TRYRA|nr:GMP-PDE, delta subunit family protein [Trypanosoma rangeli]RNE97430.1 GMP-PDE, delta subunit family protein [Trypanosoma rangeli]|eukprot:RNE97430.1 GMP-PDE, delta subunit family protein [Trypanosoma rangeli]
MAANMHITPEQVLQFSAPTSDFLCPLTANTYNIEFYRFTIRDMDTGKVVFDVERDHGDYPPPETLRQLSPEMQQLMRTISYTFPPSLLRRKTIGAKLVFGVNGDAPVPNFRMIERHYFRNTLIKSFDFTFGFCIPHSTNTWEAIYDMPTLSEEWVRAIIASPNETVSDSFYFVDNKLMMHNKAYYAYNAREEDSVV